MRKKSFYTIGLLIFFSSILRISSQQLNTNNKSKNTNDLNLIKIDSTLVASNPIAINDSLVKKEPLLLDQIKYTAKDSVKIDQKNSKIYLYNKAELTYQNMILKAGYIVLDYEKSEVYAGRIKDSLGKLSQTPYFKQTNNEVNPDSIRFNFDTKRALIWNSKSAQSGMNVYSGFTKKENDSVYFLENAKMTTSSNPTNPDYYIRISRGKMVPGKKIIAGFTNLYIADIPTPVALPFAYFPTTQNNESGFIFPTIGESNDRGYYLQNGGYYLPLSKYYDLNILGDYYTNGSYGLRFDTQYRVNYKFRGRFSYRYEKLIQGEKGFPDYSQSTIYNIRWSHSKDGKSNPQSTFSASVNLGSSSYFQESVNQLNSSNFLNNTMSSSVSYSKTFPEYPRINIALTTSLSQNKNTKIANLTLPTFTANMERIYPFAKKDGIKKGIIQNINFQISTRGENRITTTEEFLFKKEMFDDAKSGMRFDIPITTNFKLFKYFSISASSRYNETISPNTISYKDYTAENGVVKDTVKGIASFRQYNFSTSVGTTIYGTFNFGYGSKIQSIRHTIRPSITYAIQPSFEKYYDTYIIDANGKTAEYTRFENSLFGTPSKGYSNSLGISINNNFEAKVKSKDTTQLEPEKIKILNNLNLTSNYNFAADSLNWSPVRVSSGISLFKEKINVNFGATLDPYALDNNNNRIGSFNISKGGGLFRLTSANINTGYSISSKDFEKDDKKDKKSEDEDKDEDELTFQQIESLSGGGREDDLFGLANDFSDGRTRREIKSRDTEKGINYRTKIPWDLKFAYSLTYSNARRQNDFSNNSLMVSGNIDLTPKWIVGFSSGYDFKGKGITYTQFRFDRDLDSWQLNFTWVPFGRRASWNFFIGIKSGLLSDLKYDKRREPDRRLR